MLAGAGGASGFESVWDGGAEVDGLGVSKSEPGSADGDFGTARSARRGFANHLPDLSFSDFLALYGRVSPRDKQSG